MTVGMKTSDGEKVEKKLSLLHPDLQGYISKETMVIAIINGSRSR